MAAPAIYRLALAGAVFDATIGMILSVLPVHLVEDLGADAGTVGLIEGLGEAIAALAFVAAGYWSDRLGQRRIFLLIGDGAALLGRLGYGLGGSIAFLGGARLLDRVGRAAASTPRNALVGEIAGERAASGYGALYGFIALGTVIGPLLAAVLVAQGARFHLIAWIAFVPAALAWLLYWTVADPPRPARTSKDEPAESWRGVGGLALYGIGMAIAQVGWPFLLLAGRRLGLSESEVALLFALLCLTQGLGALAAGRFRLRPALVLAALGFALAGLGVAVGTGVAVLALAIAIWGASLGLYMASGSAAMLRVAPPTKRGLAFGLGSLAAGGTALVTGPGFGTIIDLYGFAPAFLAGAVVALLVAGLTWRLSPPAWR
ncbi:MAG: MFS transporter [Alphaproteobacteria bacterium]|nr:MFS transporter [Alphaproteobacteria bacterium]